MVIFAVFAALWPMLMDMYSPIMPAIALATGSSSSLIQFSVTSTLIGFASAYLLVGPLADRFGRKPVLLGGIVLYLTAAFAIANSSSVDAIIGWRMLQGIGACCCPALCRTMIQDLYGHDAAPRVLGYMAALMTSGTMLTPLLAGWMISIWPWQSVFWFMTGYAALCLVLVSLLLPESMRSERGSMRPGHVLSVYARMLRSRQFMFSTLGLAAMFSGNACFIALGSFIMIDQMQLSPLQFGLYFIVIECGFIIGSVLSARLDGHISDHALYGGGVLLGIGAGVAMGLQHLLWPASALTVVIPMILYTCALGVVLPHSATHAMSPFPAHTGAAASLLGFLQIGIAALVTGIVGALPLISSGLLAAVLLACSLTGLGCLRGMELSRARAH